MNGNQICLFCELSITKVKSMMSDPNFVKVLRSKINVVCSKLPHDFQQYCLDYNKQYFDIGLALLKQLIATPNACSTIYLCPISYSSEQAGNNFFHIRININKYFV